MATETIPGVYALTVVERGNRSPYDGTTVTFFRASTYEEAAAYFRSAVLSVNCAERSEYDTDAEYESAVADIDHDLSDFVYDGFDWFMWAKPVEVTP